MALRVTISALIKTSEETLYTGFIQRRVGETYCVSKAGELKQGELSALACPLRPRTRTIRTTEIHCLLKNY